MVPVLSLCTGAAIGISFGAIFDRFHNPIDNKEGLICCIAGLSISLIGMLWGNIPAGFATLAAITATLHTLDDPKGIVPKLLIRLTFSILFGALGIGLTPLLK